MTDIHGGFCWNELLTRDVARTKAFYRDVIGWTFEPTPTPAGGTYWIASIGGRKVAGLFDLTQTPGCETISDHWVPYLAVDDVDARAKAAVEAGATLHRDIFDIPGVGRVALIGEPGGAGLAWMTPFAPSTTTERRLA